MHISAIIAMVAIIMAVWTTTIRPRTEKIKSAMANRHMANGWTFYIRGTASKIDLPYALDIAVRARKMGWKR